MAFTTGHKTEGHDQKLVTQETDRFHFNSYVHAYTGTEFKSKYNQ